MTGDKNGNSNNNNSNSKRTNSDDKDVLMEDVKHLNASLKELEETVKRQLSQHGKGDPLASIFSNVEGIKRPMRTLSILRKADKADDTSMPNRKDKVVVQVRVVLLKVGDIDTLRDKFAGDAFIQAKWREPALDGKFKMVDQFEPLNWEVYWNPKLSIENAFGEPKENVWHSLTFDGAGQATVCEKRRITGTFFEFMELNQFPFDSQMLSVSVTTERSDNEVEFVEDSLDKSVLFTTSFTDEQEWKLNKGIITWIKFREESFRSESMRHPSFSAAATVTRRPQFFIWNILVVMFLICSLSFATFSVSYDIPQTRLQLTFILLLTTVSFKFVVNQNLPMISYLTYLDKYILGSMAILASICVWHAIAGYLSKRTPCIGSLLVVDYWMLGVLGSIYLGFHVFFVIIISCKSNNKDSGDEPDDKDLFCEHQEDEFEDQRTSTPTEPSRPIQKSDHRGNRRVSDADQVTAQAALSSWQ